MTSPNKQPNSADGSMDNLLNEFELHPNASSERDRQEKDAEPDQMQRSSAVQRTDQNDAARFLGWQEALRGFPANPAPPRPQPNVSQPPTNSIAFNSNALSNSGIPQVYARPDPLQHIQVKVTARKSTTLPDKGRPFRLSRIKQTARKSTSRPDMSRIILQRPGESDAEFFRRWQEAYHRVFRRNHE